MWVAGFPVVAVVVVGVKNISAIIVKIIIVVVERITFLPSPPCKVNQSNMILSSITIITSHIIKITCSTILFFLITALFRKSSFAGVVGDTAVVSLLLLSTSLCKESFSLCELPQGSGVT